MLKKYRFSIRLGACSKNLGRRCYNVSKENLIFQIFVIISAIAAAEVAAAAAAAAGPMLKVFGKRAGRKNTKAKAAEPSEQQQQQQPQQQPPPLQQQQQQKLPRARHSSLPSSIVLQRDVASASHAGYFLSESKVRPEPPDAAHANVINGGDVGGQQDPAVEYGVQKERQFAGLNGDKQRIERHPAAKVRVKGRVDAGQRRLGAREP